MGRVLSCKEVELLKIPEWATDIVYSNGDGGSEGIRYRCVKWIESLSRREYYDSVQSQMVVNAKKVHDRVISELKSVDTPTFFVDDESEED